MSVAADPHAALRVDGARRRTRWRRQRRGGGDDDGATLYIVLPRRAPRLVLVAPSPLQRTPSGLTNERRESRCGPGGGGCGWKDAMAAILQLRSVSENTFLFY